MPHRIYVAFRLCLPTVCALIAITENRAMKIVYTLSCARTWDMALFVLVSADLMESLSSPGAAKTENVV